MKNKIAIALVHGIGKECLRFAERMIRNIKIELGSLAENCVFEPIHWAPLAQTVEDEIWKRLRFGKLTTARKWWHFKFTRKFMIDFVGDGVSYQPLPKEKGMYEKIHWYFANRLRVLAEKAGLNAPLCVISHSLGTIISSNYFYDLQNRNRKPEIIPDKVKEVQRETPLENGETLALFYTMGSPIAVWSMRYPEFGQPIEFPYLSKDVEKQYPDLRNASEWVNLYSKDDVIGYPLKPLNEKYNKVVTEDLSMYTGWFPMRYTPISHIYYWNSKKVAKRIAKGLKRILEITK